jgi:hypothetical protein
MAVIRVHSEAKFVTDGGLYRRPAAGTTCTVIGCTGTAYDARCCPHRTFTLSLEKRRAEQMAQNNNGLPEGTDTVIEGGGAGGTGGGSGRSGTSLGGGSPSTSTNSTGARTSTTASESQTDALITATTASTGTGTGSGDTGAGSTTGSTGSTGDTGGDTGTGSNGGSGSSSGGGIRGLVGNVTTKAKDEAFGRARGLVGDGLKSGSSTLGNIAGIIEDTVEQIGERLGPQYADYARTASSTINRYASTLENKDPDELVDDARDLIRKSPGVALTGAAILGFGLVRLLKVGLPEEGNNGTANRQSDRTGSTR